MLPFLRGGLGISLVFFSHFPANRRRAFTPPASPARGAAALGVIGVLFLDCRPSRCCPYSRHCSVAGCRDRRRRTEVRPKWLMELFSGLAVLAALALPAFEQPSPYKDLSQALNIARGEGGSSNVPAPWGGITVVENIHRVHCAMRPRG